MEMLKTCCGNGATALITRKQQQRLSFIVWVRDMPFAARPLLQVEPHKVQ